jgi:hypothetical protein
MLDQGVEALKYMMSLLILYDVWIDCNPSVIALIL